MVGLVGSPALVADCVMTIGATDEAEMTLETTIVVTGSMVVVLSALPTEKTLLVMAEEIELPIEDDEPSLGDVKFEPEVVEKPSGS